jgi:hypothetical protein
MTTLRKLFFLQRIYFRQTPVQIFYFYLLPVIAASVLWLHKDASWFWTFYVAATVLAYFFVRTCLRSYIVYELVKNTPDKLALYTLNSQISYSAVSYELNNVDKLRLLGEGPSWKLYYAVFNFYQHSKYGDYLSKQAYYTVFEAQLIRNIPHLIFDSTSAKRRQFKNLYLQSQRLSLEGNFDDKFDTYSPQNYQIDTLSFITPEVMQAMLVLQQYDIELFDSKMLCYGPLLSASEFEAMKQACLTLAAELNDNLRNYRDDRLLGQDRKADVTPFARALLKSPMKYMPAFIMSLIGFGAVVFAAFKLSDIGIMFSQPALVVDIFLISSLFKILKITSTNKRTIREYGNGAPQKSGQIPTVNQ